MKFALALLLFAAPARAALFGISPRMFNKKVNEMQNATQKQFSENELKLTGLESRIEKLEVNISAQAQAVAKVQAGYDRSVSQNVGRDMTTTTTNDTDLMKQIFQGLSALFLTIIGFLKAQINILSKQNSYLSDSRKKYQDRFLKLLSPEYAKLVEQEQRKNTE